MGCYVRVGLLMRRELGQVRLRLWWVRHLQREAKPEKLPPFLTLAMRQTRTSRTCSVIIEVAKGYCGLTAKKGLMGWDKASTRVICTFWSCGVGNVCGGELVGGSRLSGPGGKGLLLLLLS